MNNTKTTSITLIAMAFAVAIAVPQADAHSSSTTKLGFHPFLPSDTDQKIWYDINSLDDVKLDGIENVGSSFRLIGEVSRQAIDNTDLDLVETKNWAYGDNAMDAAYKAGKGNYGWTIAYGSGANLYKFVYFNTNNAVDYLTTAGCTNKQDMPNPQYISNHEFGHLAGLAHHGSASNSHTAMKPGCNPGQSSLSATDIANINAYYN